METVPRLIEPGTKYFLKHTLMQCHNIKNNYFNLIYNIVLLILFIIILILILYFRYKGNVTPQEKKLKEKKEKEYIMSKLIQANNYKKNNVNTITNLPNWYDNSESIILNKKLY
jgi:hypothetical protein